MTDETIEGIETTCPILGRPVRQYSKCDPDWINLKDLETGLFYRVSDLAQAVSRTRLDTASRARIRAWLEQKRVPCPRNTTRYRLRHCEVS